MIFTAFLDSCLMPCRLVLYQKSTSVVSGPMPQLRMPSACPLCHWAWTPPLQLPPLPTTIPATCPTPPSPRTGGPLHTNVLVSWHVSALWIKCASLGILTEEEETAAVCCYHIALVSQIFASKSKQNIVKAPLHFTKNSFVRKSRHHCYKYSG